jgi:hypothetical protein
MRTDRQLAVALGTFVALAAGACRQTEERRADHAADMVAATARALDQARVELARRSAASTLGADRVARRAIQAAKADQEFELRRDLVVRGLRAKHDVIAHDMPMLAALASSMQVDDDAHAKMRESLTGFQIRVDDAGLAIDDLETVPAATWKPHERAVDDDMRRLEHARAEAWHAIARGVPLLRG